MQTVVKVFFCSSGGMRRSPLGMSATNWPLGPAQDDDDDDDDDDCGAVRMRIGKGNRNTQTKFAPVPLCPPQIPHYQTWARTQATMVGSR
jgi:hypothetical protein